MKRYDNELLTLREVFDYKQYKWITAIRTTQDKREITYDGRDIESIRFLDIDTENSFRILVYEFEEGHNQLEIINGKAYEIRRGYNGFLIKQRVFILPK